MDSITIFSTIFKYGLLALAAVAVLAVVYVAAYAVYRKALHGTKTMSPRQWIVLILLSGWLVVVLGLTTLSRGANYTGSVNFSLLSGYVSAWNQWSYTELQLIIFNMLMFAPLGFLLPFLAKKGRRLSVACLVSFAVTLFIETLQLATGRGIFELDDLLHNFVGSMFGYFVAAFFLDCAESRKVRVKPLLRMLAIPLIFAIGISAAIVAYGNQKYGNWAFVPAEKQDMSRVSIECGVELSDEAATMSVYKNKYANNFDYGAEICGKFADFVGMDLRKTVRREDDNRIYESEDGSQITYFARDGFWSYVNWEDAASLDDDAIREDRERLEAWLGANGLLPANAEFSVQNGTMLRWDVEAGELGSGSDDSVSGLIMAQFDAANVLASFDCYISCNEYVGTEEVRSPQEAYGQVLAGNFEQYNPFEPGDVLHIETCSLEYAYDTKGYYRPVYKFSGYVNERDFAWDCLVSAAK